MNIFHDGNAICCKPGDHKGCTCTQIRCTHARTCVFLNATDNGNIALHLDICSHAGKFIHVLEAVLKNALGNGRRTIRHTKHNRHLRLHICRKSRIRKRRDLGMGQALVGNNTNSIIKFLDHTACLDQLGRCSFQMLWNNIFDQDITLGRCCRAHKGSRLDLIRNDRIRCLV